MLRCQVSRDLAIGARDMLEIQSYSNGRDRYDNNAYTIGSLCFCTLGLLKFFTMYLTPPADPTGRPTYHMVEIKSFILTESAEACREGIGWFRNSREFAKEVRDGAIASANKMAHDRHGGASSLASTNKLLLSSSSGGVAGLVPKSCQNSLTTQDSIPSASGSGQGEP